MFVLQTAIQTPLKQHLKRGHWLTTFHHFYDPAVLRVQDQVNSQESHWIHGLQITEKDVREVQHRTEVKALRRSLSFSGSAPELTLAPRKKRM